MQNIKLKKLILSAMFLGIGLVLPFITGQIQQIGNMLLPMHIPVLLCGLICGWQYGIAVGFIMPILRSFLFSMPHMFPNAVSMAFELATYGFTVGFLYSNSRWKCIKSLFKCMIVSMLAGRIVWGIVQVILLGAGNNGFTFHAFFAGAFLNAVPGIILQLILIPAIMVGLHRAKLVPLIHKGKKHDKQNKKSS